MNHTYPASILYKSTAGRYRPVSYPDGPMMARCRFIKNAYWVNHPFSLNHISVFLFAELRRYKNFRGHITGVKSS